MDSLTRIVLLSPEPATQRRVQMAMAEHGVLVAAAAQADDALRLLELESPVAVVVDARRAPERTFAMAHAKRVPRLLGLIDAQDGDTARHLLASGVAEVVPIPLVEALLMHRLRRVLQPSGSPVPSSDASKRRRKGDLLVGTSEELVAVTRRIDMIAKSDIGAAIFGETGTGKELAARTIHARSRRADQPLVVVNCTALPETLFENELFGHERGAFTGADTRKEGLLAEAEGGTMLLDEIGDIAMSVQAKLLRLLQFGEYKMVGGTKTLKADVRILTSTHRNLEAAVAERRFREDLFYRMNTLRVELPPLRDRLEDIPLLVDHFCTLYNRREGSQCDGFTPAAIRRLQAHRWPGNVRELESVVYRSIVLAGGRSRLDQTDVDIHQEQAPPSRP